MVREAVVMPSKNTKRRLAMEREAEVARLREDMAAEKRWWDEMWTGVVKYYVDRLRASGYFAPPNSPEESLDKT